MPPESEYLQGMRRALVLVADRRDFYDPAPGNDFDDGYMKALDNLVSDILEEMRLRRA